MSISESIVINTDRVPRHMVDSDPSLIILPPQMLMTSISEVIESGVNRFRQFETDSGIEYVGPLVEEYAYVYRVIDAKKFQHARLKHGL